MTRAPAKRSLSVFRGQAEVGIGEGAGRSITWGEQYLAADKPLCDDVAWLERARPWLSLDLELADLEELGDQLEGWSAMAVGDNYVVCRLMPAGRFRQRIAYFSHARVWPITSFDASFDPGLHLGRGEAYERPWREQKDRSPPASADAVELDLGILEVENEAAVQLLACLYQSMVLGEPLVVAVPLEEFARGSRLAQLLSIARAALPGDLKRRCSIRLYSRHPRLFLQHLGTNVLAIPEDLAGTSLTACRHAVLLDRSMNVRAGRAPAAGYLEYAEAVLKATRLLPEGLLAFTERVVREEGQGPDLQGASAIAFTYNLAFALSRGEEAARAFVDRSLIGAANRLGPDVDWSQLLTAKDWASLPREALTGLVLRSRGELGAGAQRLQAAAELAVARLKIDLTPYVGPWWKTPVETWKAVRLCELLAQEHVLVDREAVAQLTSGVPTLRLLDVPDAHLLLEAERHAGALSRRDEDEDELAKLACDVRTFEVLESATPSLLTSGWLETFLGRANRDLLVAAARAFFSRTEPLRARHDSSEALLDALRRHDSLPAELCSPLLNHAENLDPAHDFAFYLRIVDVTSRWPRTEGDNLLERLRLCRNDMRTDDEAALVDAALSTAWREPTPKFLTPNGCLLADWLEDYAERLLAHPEVREGLRTRALLRLADRLNGTEPIDAILEIVERRMGQPGDREPTTKELIRANWWLIWRHSRERNRKEARDLAMGWLTSSAWSQPGLEPTLESWDQVIYDLGEEALTNEELVELFGDAEISPSGEGGPASGFPWVSAFEDRQLGALSQAAPDFGALARIAEVAAQARVGALPQLSKYLLQVSGQQGDLPAHSLLSLMPGQRGSTGELTLRQSELLVSRAGLRKAQALESAAQIAVAHLDNASCTANPLSSAGAIDVIDRLGLWSRSPVVAAFLRWVEHCASSCALPRAALETADRALDQTPGDLTSDAKPDLSRRLYREGFRNIATLFDPEVHEEQVGREIIARCVAALRRRAHGDPVWSELARLARARREQSDQGVSSKQDPILELAERAAEGFSGQAKNDQSREWAWSTFVDAGRTHREFWTPGQDVRRLPCLNVVRGLLPDLGTGQAAIRVSLAPLVMSPRLVRQDPSWWSSMFSAMKAFGSEMAMSEEGSRTAFSLLLRQRAALPKDVARALLKAYRNYSRGGRRSAVPEIRSMYDSVTLFSPRNGSGSVYCLGEIATKCGTALGKAYSTKRLSKQPNLQDYKRDLKAAHAGGLLVYQETRRDGSSTLHVEAFSQSNYEKPSQIIELKPGYPPKWIPLENKRRYERGDHFLIPVDSDSEHSLDAFVHQLGNFTPDMESLLLNIIARPDLETRIAEIESEIWERRPPPSLLTRLVTGLRTLTRWATLSAASLVIVGGGLLMLLNQRGIRRLGIQLEELRSGIREGTIPSGGQAASGHGEQTPVSESTENEETETEAGGTLGVSTAVVQLIHALDTAPQESLRRLIYDTHLQDLAAADADQILSSQDFSWAVGKLLIARYDPKAGEPKSRENLGIPDHYSGTKMRLDSLSLTDQEKAALAFSCCRSFREPGFPARLGSHYQAVLLAESCNKASTNEVQAAAGFAELAEWTRK